RTGQYAIFGPTRRDVPVRLNGKEVGTVGRRGGRVSYLLDTSGKHSYRLRTRNYAPEEFQKLLREGEGTPPPKTEQYENALWHALPTRLDDALEPARDRVVGKAHDIAAWKTELVRLR